MADEIVEARNRMPHDEVYHPPDHDLLVAMERFVEPTSMTSDSTPAPCNRRSTVPARRSIGSSRPTAASTGASATKRLVRCHDELSQPSGPPELVHHVARRWGFANPSHFPLLFVGKFGLPPSALSRRVEFEPAGLDLDPDVRARVAETAQVGARLGARPHRPCR